MRYFILASLCCFLVTGNAHAQAKMKFGHIDSQKLLEVMPDKKQADATLEEFAKQLEKQLQAMTAEWESKVQDYRNNESVMSDIIKQTKAEEIQNLEQRIQAFQQNAQQSLAKKEGEVYQPILDKARLAIEEVSKENGYTYVFDSSSGALLYQPEGDDIIALVKKKLGITEEASTAPAVPTNQ